MRSSLGQRKAEIPWGQRRRSRARRHGQVPARPRSPPRRRLPRLGPARARPVVSGRSASGGRPASAQPVRVAIPGASRCWPARRPARSRVRVGRGARRRGRSGSRMSLRGIAWAAGPRPRRRAAGASAPTPAPKPLRRATAPLPRPAATRRRCKRPRRCGLRRTQATRRRPDRAGRRHPLTASGARSRGIPPGRRAILRSCDPRPLLDRPAPSRSSIPARTTRRPGADPGALVADVALAPSGPPAPAPPRARPEPASARSPHSRARPGRGKITQAEKTIGCFNLRFAGRRYSV